ncbi:MAG: pilus assembly protein [Actinobacteria bacterium 13_2_20CM_2_71_6]|nr:MAG: pilus assembly protein [Actinobacteria bacterium 13_2_20CM_2_71_6]
MNYLVAKAQALWATRDQGATAVEYGLMVALIAVVIVVAVTALGSKLSALFNSVTASV